MYDTPDQATIRIDLRSVDARVGGDVLGRCVNVSNGDAKVFIKFSLEFLVIPVDFLTV